LKLQQNVAVFAYFLTGSNKNRAREMHDRIDPRRMKISLEYRFVKQLAEIKRNNDPKTLVRCFDSLIGKACRHELAVSASTGVMPTCSCS
jgi:hypothetical protein